MNQTQFQYLLPRKGRQKLLKSLFSTQFQYRYHQRIYRILAMLNREFPHDQWFQHLCEQCLRVCVRCLILYQSVYNV